MENKENKLIADKINSLDYLPEGYEPNLDAKWALLQSEEKKPEVIFLFERKTWTKVAALLIILFLSTAIWLIKFRNSANEFTTVQPTSAPSSIAQSEHNSLQPIVEQKSVENNSIRNIPSTKKPEKKIISVPLKENSVAEIQLPSLENMIDVTLPTEEAVIAKSEIKKSGHRYVQMDFNDEIKPNNEKNTYAQGIQFRLMIKNSNPANQKSDDNTSFKLKHNF